MIKREVLQPCIRNSRSSGEKVTPFITTRRRKRCTCYSRGWRLTTSRREGRRRRRRHQRGRRNLLSRRQRRRGGLSTCYIGCWRPQQPEGEIDPTTGGRGEGVDWATAGEVTGVDWPPAVSHVCGVAAKTSPLKIYLMWQMWGDKEFLSFINGKKKWESPYSILVTRNPNWS